MTDKNNANSDQHHLTLRPLEPADYEDMKEIMEHVYPVSGPWTEQQFGTLIRIFPDGQICIEDNGKVVAAALSIIVNYKKWGDRHTYDQITAKGTFATHDPKGETLYGIDIFVHPEYRNMRLGRRLYDARKELCYEQNLRGIIAGGRVPGYADHESKLKPQEYVKMVRAREIYDPVLSFQLSNGFHVRRVMRGYMPEDGASKTYATLLEWLNIYFEDAGDETQTRSKESVRVGAVQWQMRTTTSLDDFFQQVEYFVDAVSDYEADIVLFPEFFNGPLMVRYNQLSPSEAVRKLAGYTDQIREEMVKFAISYNINIIAGSMPEYKDGKLRNVSYLCRRDGTWDQQYKLHVTPDEVDYWGMTGGDKINVFETDFGRIGILICYDAEFPELCRLMAEQGMQILFVPYWTDTKNSYLRVRTCAHARAIENECYVVMSGSTGNLPKVVNMDMQYSQAAVLTPSDFAFPHDGIAAEATPNTEMTLIADLDLYNLIELHSEGAVRNLKDRRKDLYKLTAIHKN